MAVNVTSDLPLPGVRAQNRLRQMILTGEPDECWPYTGRLDDKGYGFIKVWGRTTRVHRVAWTLANDRWPDANALVCHSCDNPPCCNPAHLALGTPSSNMRDRMRAGTQTKGESCHASKLKVADVYEVRRRALNGESLRGLAREFEVTPQAIGHIVRRRNWAHLPEPDALVLAAIGADPLGRPIAEVPKVNRDALTKVAWPVLAEATS